MILSITALHPVFITKNRLITTKLAQWYRQHARPLPWRQHPTPYHIWLSEIILQQTRVQQGIPYYQRFVHQFPTLATLAAAPEEQILRSWQGLGYYSRARNLHKCARHIMTKHDGHFPSDYSTLRRLPGIGPYTAAAIASIAFGQAVATVDGNVYRVLARLFGIHHNITLLPTQKKFHVLATSLLNREAPGEHNQALMEFGALHCTPQSPACHQCIFADLCVAKKKQQTKELPVKVKTLKIKKRSFHYFIFVAGNQLYLRKRKTQDIWKGLYEFHLVEATSQQSWEHLQDRLVQHIHNSHAPMQQAGAMIRHQLTHQLIYATFYYVATNEALRTALHQTSLHPFTFEEITHLPLPICLARFLERHPPRQFFINSNNQLKSQAVALQSS